MEEFQKLMFQKLMVSRHTPGVFQKVNESVVGIAGLGGLGSNVAVSLARTGVGKLILVDFDVVEPGNLNRQQYFVSHVGMNKTDAIADMLKNINPYVDIETKRIYLDETNIIECFKDADIIVEAFDNPKCKAVLVNTVLKEFKDKKIVAASGMGGYYSGNAILTKKVTDRFYLVGDGTSEVTPDVGVLAPRVCIVANHQANMVVRLIMGETEP